MRPCVHTLRKIEPMISPIRRLLRYCHKKLAIVKNGKHKRTRGRAGPSPKGSPGAAPTNEPSTPKEAPAKANPKGKARDSAHTRSSEQRGKASRTLHFVGRLRAPATFSKRVPRGSQKNLPGTISSSNYVNKLPIYRPQRPLLVNELAMAYPQAQGDYN